MANEKELQEQYGHRLGEVLSQSLDGMEELERIAANDVPRITESLFKAKLLPVLTSEDPKQSLDIWLEIAGVALRPIDVVSDRGTGEVLFRVPPLARPVDPRATRKGYGSAFEILNVAKQKHEVLPALGEEYLKDSLINAVESTPLSMEDARAWNAILVRYGHPGILPDEVTQEDKPTTSDKPLFTGEYDDL